MKIKIAFLTLVVSFIMVISCNQTNKENQTEKENKISSNEDLAIEKQSLSEGFKLLENKCYTCHSPTASMENRLGPPMIAIKKHYIDDQTSQEEFTKSLIAFLNNPSEEQSKMPGAIRRFGVMPKMNFSETEITKIADYIYNNELEKPGWFDEHHKRERKRGKHTSDADDMTPIKKGKKIALQTKSVLGKNLMQAINTKGTEHALTFCSTKAIPLTDSMALSLNAKVKRVSDKNRNPDNAANKLELAYIKNAKEAISKEQPVQPKLVTMDNKHVGYYPIIANSMCLQCHGEPNKDITASVYAKIKQLYPDDKATGYTSGELRGIWVVEMDAINN